MAGTLNKRNDDLFHTSSGVGHHYRGSYYFPSNNFKAVLHDPLPPTLARKDPNVLEEQYKTTNNSTYDRKHYCSPYLQEDPGPIYKKAPALWKVNYVKDMHEKLKPGAFRRPLSMGTQLSETHEQFRNQPGLTIPEEFMKPPQNFLLQNHIAEKSKATSGPPQESNPTGKSQVRNKGVADLLDPYLTTTNQHHRRFKPNELDGYPRKDAATYYVCEEYPKAWGHGPKHNPLPKSSVPYPRDEPMRDEMLFKSATKIRRIQNSLSALPHGHMMTTYNDNYTRPSDPKGKQAEYCPVDFPYSIPRPGAKSSFAAPGMYKSEYTSIGSRKPITLST